MEKEAKITVHPSFEIGEISPRLFSTFLEPIGTISVSIQLRKTSSLWTARLRPEIIRNS